MSALSQVSFTSPHAFTVCNAGSEKLLKANMAASHRDLRPAFMRPQLVTWKAGKALRHPPESLFARVAGLSLGMFGDMTQAGAASKTLREQPFHLHVFPREASGDGLTAEQWAQLDARASDFRDALLTAGVALHELREPQNGEWVLDVVLDVSPDGKFLVGIHRHGPETHPCPGGLPRLTLPPDAPSRAWLKMEQALVFARLDKPGALRGKTALELGSAPGGASLSLLQHGVTVFGVDAAEMDRRVLDFTSPDGAHFVHFKMNAGQAARALLPKQVDLLVCDLNAAPQVVIPIVEEMQDAVQASTFLLTLKLNDEPTAARIPEFLRRLRSFAPGPVRATQLAGNRSEFCVVTGNVC
jgi:23S rRNA (cytidine2498-2'-O)-methyltransferase